MNSLVLLAKEAVENYVNEGKVIEPPPDLPEEILKRRAGTFVTIETSEPLRQAQSKLRGCIGTYLPTRVNVAEEVIRNAISAAAEDNRFETIKKEELPHLSYTVYILSYPEPVNDLKELNPEKFGIIVKTAPFTFPNEKEAVSDSAVPYKNGLLLPGLEGIDMAEQQISIACQKGGIDPQREKFFIYRFTVEKYQQ